MSPRVDRRDPHHLLLQDPSAATPWRPSSYDRNSLKDRERLLFAR
ncbi:MAG TPA: hypothetical protein VME66_09120 [Candidatus Acidoferrales bacterium]|nr:hypothetical protein [Candidatus Acidoferrales bacterium]